MKNKVLTSATVLTLIWIANISSACAEPNLHIYSFGSREVNVRTFEPFDLWAVIENPDSMGHSYRIVVIFEDYAIAENGYISAGGFDFIYLTLVPTNYGNRTMEVRLYQDSSGGEWVDERTKSVVVEKGYLWTQIESLNDKVDSLEAENLRLNGMINTLTYALISLFILMFAVSITFWWISKKRNIEKAKTGC